MHSLKGCQTYSWTHWYIKSFRLQQVCAGQLDCTMSAHCTFGQRSNMVQLIISSFMWRPSSWARRGR